MDLQQLQATVDGIDQAKAAGQGMDGADAAHADASATRADLIVKVAGGHDRSLAAADIGPVQAALDAALAVSQFSPYDRFHSKSLLAFGVRESTYFI
jgi:hypothetical protein